MFFRLDKLSLTILYMEKYSSLEIIRIVLYFQIYHQLNVLYLKMNILKPTIYEIAISFIPFLWTCYCPECIFYHSQNLVFFILSFLLFSLEKQKSSYPRGIYCFICFGMHYLISFSQPLWSMKHKPFNPFFNNLEI